MSYNLLRLPFLALALCTILFSSCKKDDDTLESFEGEWTTSSMIVDGQEMMGTAMESMIIDFGDFNGTEGIVTVTTTEMGEDPEVESGYYTKTEADDSISMTFDGETTVFDYDMNGNTITLTGVTNNVRGYVIVMRK